MTDTAPPKRYRINPWHFVWISVVFSKLFTAVLNTIQSFFWFGKVSSELLIIGAIDALFVPLVVAPIVIYFIKQTSELIKTNVQLQQEYRIVNLQSRLCWSARKNSSSPMTNCGRRWLNDSGPNKRSPGRQSISDHSRERS